MFNCFLSGIKSMRPVGIDMGDEKTQLKIDGKTYDLTHEDLQTIIEDEGPVSPWAEKLLQHDDRIE